VRNAIVEGLAAYATSARTDFVISHAAMVVLAITQHDWTVPDMARTRTPP